MSVGCTDYSELIMTETFLQEIGRIGSIVNDEDAFLGGISFGLRFCLNRFRFGVGRSRWSSSILDWNGQGEGRAFAKFTRGSQIPTQHTGEVGADGESPTSAAIVTCGAGMSLLKFIEDATQSFFTDADASIDDGDVQCSFIALLNGKGDLALMCKLGGVAKQIDDDLFDLILIGINDSESWVHLLFKSYFGFDERHGEVGTLICQRANTKVGGNDIHATRFDLGDIEYSVDQAQQMLGTGEDFLQILQLFYR